MALAVAGSGSAATTLGCTGGAVFEDAKGKPPVSEDSFDCGLWIADCRSVFVGTAGISVCENSGVENSGADSETGTPGSPGFPAGAAASGEEGRAVGTRAGTPGAWAGRPPAVVGKLGAGDGTLGAIVGTRPAPRDSEKYSFANRPMSAVLNGSFAAAAATGSEVSVAAGSLGLWIDIVVVESH